MLNMMGKKYLAEYITSKDNTKDIIDILAKFFRGVIDFSLMVNYL